MKRAILAASVACLLLPCAAAAADQNGLYLGGAGGVSLPRDSDTSDVTGDRSVSLDTGFGLSGSVGYALPNGFRPEFELGYLANDVDSVGGTNARGDVGALKMMGNLLYDFRNTGLPVTPFIGGGLGFARVHADGIDPFSNTRIDDSDMGFAYQAIAGASRSLGDGLDLTLDYRFVNVPWLHLKTDSLAQVDAEYSTHVVMLGLRYTFGAPPKPEPKPAAQPAPPPQPPKQVAPAAPKPPRNYIVFFDWDRADLRDDARQIIRTAVDNLEAVGGVVRIVLTGHADRSGADAYNLKLSQRRADSVKAELQRLGVTTREISTVAKGEREPLVATDDGVREPRNRRVEIVLQ